MAEHKGKYTIRKHWKGQLCYKPGDNFELYEPDGLTAEEKNSWQEKVKLRETVIENNIGNIFGNKFAVKKVAYSNRFRSSFSCTKEDCNFNSVDLAKHLKVKHKWSTDAVKLQTTYSNSMFNHFTRMSTWHQPKPKICIKCRIVVERIDTHIAHKHQNQIQSDWQT